MKELVIAAIAIGLVVLILMARCSYNAKYVGHPFTYKPTGEIVIPVSEIDRTSPSCFVVRRKDGSTIQVSVNDLTPAPEHQ